MRFGPSPRKRLWSFISLVSRWQRSGDSKKVADSVAHDIGIDGVAAEVLPADKASAVSRFQEDGARAPRWLPQTLESRSARVLTWRLSRLGIVLARSDPRDVVGAIELSRATYRKMIQNLVWATAYNIVAIPVAAGLLVRWGVDPPMSVGAVAMSLPTIIVAVNAQLLRRLKLQRETLELEG